MTKRGSSNLSIIKPLGISMEFNLILSRALIKEKLPVSIAHQEYPYSSFSFKSIALIFINWNLASNIDKGDAVLILPTIIFNDLNPNNSEKSE